MSHVSAVRSLYKKILKLHRSLPPDLKAIGDQYCKAEFKLHKNAAPEYVVPFMKQWEEYAKTLEVQLATSCSEEDRFKPEVGANLPENILDESFSSDQVLQLHELMKETTKPNPQFNIKEEK